MIRMNIQIEANIQEKLVRAALHARKSSYAPYSNYRVGAAILTEDGSIFEGCNIENATYGATNCAERTAAFKAVSEGHRNFKMIAIAGGPDQYETDFPDLAYPCGICRQVLREFSDPKELIVIVVRSGTDVAVHTLEDLLPNSFGPDHLKEG